MKLNKRSTVTALVLVLALIAAWVLPVSAGGGTPTVNGLFYSDGDKDRYYLLGENPGRGTLYYNRDGDTLYLAVVVSHTVNDNVFGQTKGGVDEAYVKSAGWSGSGSHHRGDALIQSDKVELKLQCGGSTYDWYHGYLYDADHDEDPHEADWRSGYLDNSGGGGTPPPGLISSASSLQWNLNNAATNNTWDVTLVGTRNDSQVWKSPFDDGQPNQVPASYPDFDTVHQWEWAMVYEMSIDVSACGSNDITITVPSAHNSPPKSGSDDVPICPGGCTLTGIGDYVWYDVNMNGLQDGGEVGLPGVTVNLYKSDGTPAGSTTTNSDGLYRFTDLTPGDYYVEFVLPNDDYSFSRQGQGSDGAVDSDADPTTGRTVTTTLTSGEIDLTWDAGLHLCTIGDRVWYDQNGDGKQELVFGVDWDYEGFNSVEVYLFRDDGDGIFEPGTTGTDPDGNFLHMTTTVSGTSQTPDGYDDGIYGFDMPSLGLGLGKYWVWVNESTLPAGTWVLTTPDPNNPQNPLLVDYQGGDDFSIDFGFVAGGGGESGGKIGDRVWHDQDGDGFQTGGWDVEGFNSVDVYLYSSLPTTCGQLAGKLDKQTTGFGTSQTPAGFPDGIYKFNMNVLGPGGNQLPAGTYWVCVDVNTLPFATYGWKLTTTTKGNPQQVTYNGVNDDFSIDFGFEPQGPPTAVTLSSFAAKSSAGGSVNPLWLGLAGLTVLAAGSLFWKKRRTS